MKKQKRILKTIILIMLIVLLTPMVSFAATETEETSATVYTKTNTDIYNLGENVQATVDWEINNMGQMIQAIGFTLQYDANKLEFVSGEIRGHGSLIEPGRPLEDAYYNIDNPGTLSVSVASFDDYDFFCIHINFKTKEIGETSIKLVDVDCMSDKNLVSPDTIDFTTNSLATIKTVAFGDIDLNGTVDIGDVTILMQYLENGRELTDQQLENTDVNLDGVVDEIDVLLIRKYLAETIFLPIRYGDVNLDGKIGGLDEAILKRTSVDELTEQQLINADVNLDGLINKNDCQLMLESQVGKAKLPTKIIIGKNIKTYNLENVQIINGFDVSKKGLIRSELVKNFQDVNMSIKVLDKNDNELINDNDIVGTDSIVRILLQEYTVVIYGDTTGDGKINAVDALAVIKDINNKIPFTNEIYRTAGKVYSDVEDELSAIDALAIIKYTNGKYEINQSK